MSCGKQAAFRELRSHALVLKLRWFFYHHQHACSEHACDGHATDYSFDSDLAQACSGKMPPQVVGFSEQLQVDVHEHGGQSDGARKPYSPAALARRRGTHPSLPALNLARCSEPRDGVLPLCWVRARPMRCRTAVFNIAPGVTSLSAHALIEQT